MLRSLTLSRLPKLPPDPSNKYADDPRAADFGHRLFFDTRLSSNDGVACVTCHQPALNFSDGLKVSVGVGVTDRNAPTIVGAAYNTWFFWDGRKDSQWSQALGPWESPVEHGGSRNQYAPLIARYYRAQYETVFGPMPDLSVSDGVNRVFANMGKAVAAYERLLAYGPSRFDRYVESLAATGRAPAGVLSEDEVSGLRLFIGKANCASCHSGPLFTDQAFHNIGVPGGTGLPEDVGRAAGASKVLADEFNCRSVYSDNRTSCPELDFAVTSGEDLVEAFKTPSLRNVTGRAPYMHAGQFATLEEVVAHYDSAPPAPAGRSELHPLGLSARERRQLIAFLGALSAPLTTPDSLLTRP